jgi:hypothetical protein
MVGGAGEVFVDLEYFITHVLIADSLSDRKVFCGRSGGLEEYSIGDDGGFCSGDHSGWSHWGFFI